ncbi:MAG: DUF1549 domain-containing protein, partial [Planctomycetaceae bacterium]|nr:DUF1549 domain-containing protein [Planctomycetaceae bacterium]
MNRPLLRLLTYGILLGGSAHGLAVDVIAAEPTIDFNRDIQPLLSENCYFCHGPDAGHREGDLRLDTPQGAAAALHADAPDESEFLKRIRSTDPDGQMPPPDSNRLLSSEQIELLERWVREGAQWGTHWSFRPLSAPSVPDVTPVGEHVFVRNPIDAFVQSQLQAQSLAASPEADRRTLIRRVTLDLTGLPPTPAEVEAFLSDTSPEAYERLVDRLLASPTYGERMAWDWLDAARYADSNGYQGDRERTMWPWRDWVVRAF